MKIKKFIIFIVSVTWILLSACNSKPDSATEKAWQTSFRNALVVGYLNFKGHYVDSDTSVYIFSYIVPSTIQMATVFPTIKKQISDYELISESDNELVLRQSGKNKQKKAFNEYRFLMDEQHRKVTVMFLSIDSAAENENYPFFIQEFRRLHKGERKS
jgi:hypothetical protein